MVRGSPRHSESNGGVERVNQTVQAKLGTWMRDTHSRRWTVGCRVVMWRYNTQIHRTIGNVPFRLMFGQSPRVGISSLLLDTDLINTLSTKAQLNRVIEYEGMVDAWDDDEPPIDETAADAAFEVMMADNVNGVQEAAVDGEEAAVDGEAVAVDGDEAVVDGDEAATINAQEAVTTSLNRDLFGAAAASACAVAAGSQHNNDSSGDSDEDLTLGQLGQQARKNESNLKTTGDTDFTAWQVLRSEMCESAIVDCDYLQRMRLKEKVPIAYCMNVKNITKIQSFVPAILVRVSKKQWELMDENDENVEEQLEWDGDNGIANMVGMYIKHPDKEFCDYYQSLLTAVHTATPAHEDDKEEHSDVCKVTPRRSALRKRAHEKMTKAAATMKKNVMKRVGEDKVCEVGEVVHVPLKDIDKAKVDTGNLTGVIVQVDKSRSQAQVAVKSGLLKSWYVYHRLGRISGKGNDVELNGLSDALANWKSMSVITEREAAQNESMVGGQGKGDVTCNCKGPCNTNQCSCKKAGRICSSACHRNNFKCVNHDRGE